AANALRDEKILQVAVVTGGPAAAVENPVHQAHGLAVAPGQRRVHRLGRVAEALPGEGTGGLRNPAVVEALILLPEAQPGGVVAGGRRPDIGHRCHPSGVRCAATSRSLGLRDAAGPSCTPAWPATKRSWLSFHLHSRRRIGRAKPTIARSMAPR